MKIGRCFKLGVVALAAAATLLFVIGCGMGAGPQEKGTLDIRILDRVIAGARTLMPDTFDLEADHFELDFHGETGNAIGHDFTLTVDLSGVTSVDLSTGQWDVTCRVINADGLQTGHGFDSEVVSVGTTGSLTFVCLPETGLGTFVAVTGWVPAVIANAVISLNLKNFQAGAAIPVAMPIVAETATGTVEVEQGWYVATLTLRDSTVLSAGIAEAVRIASGATSTWNTFFTVSALEGGITIDVGYDPGRELTLVSNPPEGPANVFPGYERTFTVTASDATAPLTYVWYMNGVAIEVSDSPSIDFNGDDFDPGRNYYVTALVYQWDGVKATRAGSAQYTLTRSETLPAYAYDYDATVVFAQTGGRDIALVKLNASGVEISRTVFGHVGNSGAPLTFTHHEVLIAGDYVYKVEDPADMDHPFYCLPGGGSTGVFANAHVISIPNLNAAAYVDDFGSH